VTANIVARTLLGLEVKDMTSGFRIYSRNCLEDINFYETKSNGYAFQIEMTFLTSKSNKSIKEVPITFYERSLGDSKMSKVIVYEAIKYLILSAFSRRR
jgi:dolichol-phosphate mannosyltransferase